MAFTGLHVTFGYAGVSGIKQTTGKSTLSAFRMVASQTMSSANTTTIIAQESNKLGEPVVRIIASADSWVSIGNNPDATNGVRDFVPANEARDYVVKAGDKVAWILA